MPYEPKIDHGVPGEAASYWISSTPDTDYPPLKENIHVDAVVIGGGIAGITTAALLKKQGVKVAVVEAGKIVQGVTGKTSAEISASQGFLYGSLISQYGERDAQLCAASNMEAINRIESLIKEHSIDCDFARLPEYFYAANAEDVDKLKVELDCCKRVGLPASYVDKAPLPFDNYGAVKCDDQAEFHPRKYLLALANTIPGNGSFIFENTRATEIKEGMPCRVKTQKGNIIAKDVVVATHFPITNRGLLFARMDIFRSYMLGIRAEEPLEKAMFYSTEQPCHYIRSQPDQGSQLIMIGGEDHKVGQVTDTRERYKTLEKYVGSRFKVKSIDYSWSTQDNYSFGLLPFIGKITRDSMHVYVATGFRGNGMTYGTLSGMIISDMILGKVSPYRDLYDPEHFKLSISADQIQKNIDVGKTFIENRLFSAEDFYNITNGKAGVTEIGGEKEAIYRDDEGKLHSVSPICTHMGCFVRWNNAELSWDCPCHASRYTYEGKVIHSPTVMDLKKEDTKDKK